MVALLAAKAQAAPGGGGGGAHADHGSAAVPASAGRSAAGASAGMPATSPPMAGGPDAGKAVRIMHKELAALVAEARNQRDQAITLLQEAVQIEESMRPPNGAADPVKPSYEVLGEVLLRAGKPVEAAAAFDASLLRMPNRARALMGSTQAHAAAGHAATAAERHQTLMSFWRGTPMAAPTSQAAAR
jgi:hypothetical protein